MSAIAGCRACGHPELSLVLSLGETPLANALLAAEGLEAQTSLSSLLDDGKALTARVVEILRGKTSPGRPHTFTPEQVAAVVALACESTVAAELPVTHWTHELLAEEAIRRGIVDSISPATVGRFIKSGRSQASHSAALAHPRLRRA